MKGARGHVLPPGCATASAIVNYWKIVLLVQVKVKMCSVRLCVVELGWVWLCSVYLFNLKTDTDLQYEDLYWNPPLLAFSLTSVKTHQSLV